MFNILGNSLYRVESDLGTFLVNKNMRLYDINKEGKNLVHYSTSDSIYKCAWIAISNAKDEFNCSVKDVLSLNWRIHRYETNEELDIVVSPTYNGNIKREAVLNIQLLAVETVYLNSIDDLPDWDDCFPSDFRNNR